MPLLFNYQVAGEEIHLVALEVNEFALSAVDISIL